MGKRIKREEEAEEPAEENLRLTKKIVSLLTELVDGQNRTADAQNRTADAQNRRADTQAAMLKEMRDERIDRRNSEARAFNARLTKKEQKLMMIIPEQGAAPKFRFSHADVDEKWKVEKVEKVFKLYHLPQPPAEKPMRTRTRLRPLREMILDNFGSTQPVVGLPCDTPHMAYDD